MKIAGLGLAPLCAILAFAAAVPPVAADDFATRFRQAAEAGRSAHCEKILAEWGRKEPNNPDFYIKGANWYVQLAKDGVSITTKAAAPGKLVIADPTTGQAVGSISTSPPDPAWLKKAGKLLITGTEKCPKRLDIWLGVIQVCDAAGEADAEINAMLRLAAYLNSKPTDLLGKEGKPYPEPVRTNIARQFSNYASRYYQLESEAADRQLLAIATLTARAFPETVYGHNIIGNYYAAVKPDYPLAIESYRKALAIDPSDSLVWCNLGESCRRAEKFADAREAFGKVLELNDDLASVELARNLLAKLPP